MIYRLNSDEIAAGPERDTLLMEMDDVTLGRTTLTGTDSTVVTLGGFLAFAWDWPGF
jgi:hypothetical protein